VPNIALMVASSDEHFREMVRDSLINLPEAKIVAEYQEVAANLYIRVLQDLERSPGAGLIVDLSGDPEGAIKSIRDLGEQANLTKDQIDLILGKNAEKLFNLPPMPEK